MKRFLQLNRADIEDVFKYAGSLSQENGLFKINFRLKHRTNIEHYEVQSIPISNEKLFALMKTGTVDYNLFKRAICFIEDTETGIIEPFYSDHTEVKKVIKRMSISEDELNIGDKITLWDYKPYFKYYYGGLVNGDHNNVNRVIYVINETGHLQQTILKSVLNLKILKKEVGLTEQELATLLNN